MPSVIASHIPSDVTPAKVEEFFSFCGKIDNLIPLDDDGKFKKYEVVFASPKATETALLLSDVELHGTFIKVEEPPAITDGATGLAPEQGGAAADKSLEKNDAVQTGDKAYDDVEQEEKPKYAIFAQLLADGYVLSDQIIDKGIQFDKKNGISQRFNDFITDLDKKYVHSDDPESSFNQKVQQAQQSYAKSGIDEKLRQYFDDASKTPWGLKIHEYYKNFVKDVNDVHQEAVRLAGIKKKDLEEKEKTKQSTDGTTTNNEAPGESVPQFAPIPQVK
ncbi:Protein vip1 [Candida viswanathii]|uniref:Protein vip1 n=1 Tax=Candida viswanathii TaxID=5486 RepID=A0A367YG93_9ASCO|nr:Protein vip1 [Candida viswanathii]